MLTLGDIRVDRSTRVAPSETPDEVFELFSIPSFPTGEAEIVFGNEVGSDKQSVEPGTVLVSKINPRINRVWVVRPRTRHRVIASTEWVTFAPVEGIVAEYLAHYLRRDDFREYLATNVSGVGGSLMRVRPAVIDRYPLVLPPLAEQRRIVAAVEEHLSDLDAAVAGLERARAGVARYKAAVITCAVCGSDKAGEDPFNEYQLPAEWRWRSTSECCSKIDNGNTPPADKMYAGAGEIPFVKVYNLTLHGRLDFSVKPTFIDRATHEGALRRSRLLPGDVLTNIVGPPLGKVAVVPDTYPEWNTNQAVVCFRTGPDLINRYLALLFMAAPIINRLSSQARATAGQFNISLTMCRTLRIPVPPVQEQERVLAEVEHRLAVAERAAAEIDIQLARAHRLRQAILKRAFEGKLVPQDPNDEPASALLDRMRNAPTTQRARGRRGPTRAAASRRSS